MLGMVLLGKRLERGEGRLVWLEGLKGGEKGLRPMRLLGRMDDVNLVLEVLRRWLRSHVVDVVDLRCTGVVMGLLDRVGSLGRRFGWLGVMSMVDLLLLVSPLWGHLVLMMTFKTSAALMGVALPV